MTYKLYSPENNGVINAAIQLFDDGRTISFIFDPDNTDYQQYLEWLAEGNEPEAAD